MISSTWRGPWRYDVDDEGRTTIVQRPCLSGMDLKQRSAWGVRIALIGFGPGVDRVVEPGEWPRELTSGGTPYIPPYFLTQPSEMVPMAQGPVSTLKLADVFMSLQDDGSLIVRPRT